ncbi:pentapeptide repeat-containing protein [Streptomyces sp. NPDC051214]|uniref:pentapeptide repeat-containing protein n=1 Tax=Streptomyces sp. NPDC051214 TaxID=3155282 RepID=UPI00341BFBC4
MQPQRLDWARRIELGAVVFGVLLSTVVSAAAIWYSNDQVNEQLKISSRELGIAQEGQITDRYTKAVENLGDDSLDVRLGGIYALQRIMEDSVRDHPTIADVLVTFVRTHATKLPAKGKKVSPDVHAALKVIAFRDETRDGTFRLDLGGACLPGEELGPLISAGAIESRTAAQLANADLNRTDLSDSNLSSADLAGASLFKTKLSRARLPQANLASAVFFEADLRGADLHGAKMMRATIHRSDARNIDLREASLRDADLSGVNLSGANLRGADLTGTDLHNADLTGAEVDREGLLRAYLSKGTKLPEYLAEDPDLKGRMVPKEWPGQIS